MIDGLALAITLTCAAAGIAVLAAAALDRYRWRAAWPTVAILEAALLLQALLDLVGQLGGHRPAEPVTHLAYLVVSLAALPVTATQVAKNDRWSGVLLAVALIVLAVIVVRLQTTWR
ncbi:hypothetical protein [Fodinicola acaciae]|uniref:hypothetical protein n=1 Tax=Fodinicola acaciae TaxID=2681555 RepID=UPI0013D5E9AE|nr:hypothetical protein [Fodinicola acaciae]